MGAPHKDLEAADQPATESLLAALKTIGADERSKHASVLAYWQSIRGDKEFPPLHDLDPLQISDAAPSSILLELIGGGHDAEIRHLGEVLKSEGSVERIIDAPTPSVLSSIAKKLPIVAISRDFLAFEDEYPCAEGVARCWVTLLPLSAGGAWVDYVYAFVTLEKGPAEMPMSVKAPAPVEDEPAVEVEEAQPAEAELPPEPADAEPEPVEVEPEPVAEEVPVEPVGEEIPIETIVEEVPGDATAEDELDAPRPAFAKLFDKLTGGGGYYGRSVKFEAEDDEPPVEEEPLMLEEVDEQPVIDEAPVDKINAAPVVGETPVEPVAKEEPAVAEAEQQVEEPSPAAEGSLQSKLAEVRVKADEARMAKLKANAALYEGLGAAYDFALDAEEAPEQYLKLVEAQGLKIQLRSPMTPVVKLAFNGLCDETTITQLEAVLAWALERDLPRGGLAERIEAAGGIARILSGEAEGE